MSNHSESLAEISAAILSYNWDPIKSPQERAIEQERAAGNQRPVGAQVPIGRMRRYDDRIGLGYRPNR
jgi:hypothetical protein